MKAKMADKDEQQKTWFASTLLEKNQNDKLMIVAMIQAEFHWLTNYHLHALQDFLKCDKRINCDKNNNEISWKKT